jgi:hypothetical protein
MSKARGLAALGNAYNDGALSNRNLIINGAMQVAQRGTSFTSQGFTIDRFYQLLSGGTATLTQETFALGSEVDGCSSFLKQVTSSGNDYCGIIHKVENVRSLPQGKATLSFQAKGTNPAAGSFQVVVYRMHDGTTTHDTLLDTTITLTSSWQRFTSAFDVGSLAGMTTPTANSLIYIAIRQSESDLGTAAWELNITGVQLEAGDTATPFEHRSYGDELQRCQRYFQVIIANPRMTSAAAPGNQLTIEYSLLTQMRASPTGALIVNSNSGSTPSFWFGRETFIGLITSLNGTLDCNVDILVDAEL